MDTHEKNEKDVFSKAYGWEEYKLVVESGYYPYFQKIEENLGPTVRCRGKEVIMLGANNYLGLTNHPKVLEAACQAVKKYGSSTTGSRLLNGSLPIHEELEEKLAHFLNKKAALVFATGYQTNLGTMTALMSERSVAIIDKFAHASLQDGSRLSHGETLYFQHNDAQDLDRCLSKLDKKTPALVAIDGVYSIEGDLPNLPELVQVVKKHGVRLLIDDAHGLGVVGPSGKGTAHHFGLEKEVDLLGGTLSKSLASTGGFVAGDQEVIDYIKHFGRPMIFSASLVPACVAAASTALDILINEPERTQKVRDNAAFMKKELSAMGFEIKNPQAAIIPVVIGDRIKTMLLWKELLELGIYTNPFVYPATAKGSEVLRTSYLATHEMTHLKQALEAFRTVGKKYGIIP